MYTSYFHTAMVLAWPYLKHEFSLGSRAFSVGLECGLEDLPLGSGEGGDRHLDLPKDILLFRHREKHMVTLILHRAAHTQRKTHLSAPL